MKRIPLVSVLINNYNYGRFLCKAIDSALKQTYPQVEVVVVDDGSTDGSQEILKSYGNQINVVLQKNQGQAAAFNAGFECSRGEVLFLLDADDEFLPDRISTVMELLEQVDQKDLILSNALQIINTDGKTLDVEALSGSSEWKDFYGSRKVKKILNGVLNQISTPTEAYNYARKFRYIPYLAAQSSGLAITRSLAEQIFPLPHEGIKVSADVFLVKAASLLGSIYSTDEVLSLYRVHGSNNWFGRKVPLQKNFADAVDEFLNSKLSQAGKQPVFSYFDSIHARFYYRAHHGNYRSCSQELFDLATRALIWHTNRRTIALFFKASILNLLCKLRILKVLQET